MRYFDGITTIEELKKVYRKLAMKFHPDNAESGDIEVMQVINTEYETLFERLKNGNQKENRTNEKSNDFINIINVLMKYKDLTIDIVGTWLWLEKANTYTIKDELKVLGFMWSSSRKKWYFNGSREKQRVTYKQKNFNQLKMEYGCQTIKTSGKSTVLEIE